MPADKYKEIAIWTKDIFKQYGTSFVLFLLMNVNLLYMHYMVGTNDLQHTDIYFEAPLAFACFDVLLTMLFFALLTWRRRKLTYILSYAFLGFFILANIIYSRFFHNYFSPCVFSETANFHGTWWFGYVKDAFRWTDLSLVVTTALFIFCLGNKAWNKMRINVTALAVLLLMIIGAQIWYDAKDGNVKDFASCYDRYIGGYFQNSYRFNPEPTVVSSGIIRTQVVCDMLTGTEFDALDDNDIKEIDSYLAQKKREMGVRHDGTTVSGRPNIVFILVESYLSVVSDLKVNGKEVTPFLNAIKNWGGIIMGR